MSSNAATVTAELSTILRSGAEALMLDARGDLVSIGPHSYPASTPVSRYSVTLRSLWALLRTYPVMKDYTALCAQMQCPPIGSNQWADVLTEMCGTTAQQGLPKAELRTKRRRDEEDGAAGRAALDAWRQVLVDGASPMPVGLADAIRRHLRTHSTMLRPTLEAEAVHTLTDPISHANRRQPGLYAQKLLKRAVEAVQHSGPGATHNTGTAPITSGIFYIVVPPAADTVINMTNVATFMNELRFVAPDAAKFPSRERRIPLSPQCAFGETPGMEFVAIDDVSVLQTAEDWARVVCCFAAGKAWQFDRWYNDTKMSVAEALAQIPAFHVRFDEERIDDKVRQWNVTILRVARRKTNATYKDVLHARQIWDSIIKHIRTGKASIRK
eukprot:PhM_4_TR12535/c0_g1_i1/m.9221/K15175/CDC73; parafibromin